jgi:hypothetical protein
VNGFRTTARTRPALSVEVRERETPHRGRTCVTAAASKITCKGHSHQNRRSPPNGGAAGVPLHGFYVLDRFHPFEGFAADKPVSIVPMSRRDAHVAVTRNAFRLDPTDRQRLRADFDFAARPVTGVDAFELRYPRDLSLLPVVCGAVLDHLAVRA